MAENKNIEVGGRLHSIATGNVLAGANEILDDTINKKQSEINAETYRLVENVNESLANLSPEQTQALAVAAKANNNEVKLGYFECSTDGNVAVKTITDAVGYVLSKGGSIKIKMINTNTASNVTLNINSTGAKTLYYNGELVSPTNTWENNEIVEIYYDGNNYYANNIESGGKFATGEKIKNVGIDDEPTAGSENLVKSGGVAQNLKYITLIGRGDTGVYTPTVRGLCSGHTYKFTIVNYDKWIEGLSEIGNATVFSATVWNDASKTTGEEYVHSVVIPDKAISTVDRDYIVTLPTEVSGTTVDEWFISLYGRASSGFKLLVSFEDITYIVSRISSKALAGNDNDNLITSGGISNISRVLRFKGKGTSVGIQQNIAGILKNHTYKLSCINKVQINNLEIGYKTSLGTYTVLYSSTATPDIDEFTFTITKDIWYDGIELFIYLKAVENAVVIWYVNDVTNTDDTNKIGIRKNTISIVGDGDNIVRARRIPVIANHVYKVGLARPNIPMSHSTGLTCLRISFIDNSSTIITTPVLADKKILNDYYIVTAPDSEGCMLDILMRASLGEEQTFFIEDITYTETKLDKDEYIGTSENCDEGVGVNYDGTFVALRSACLSDYIEVTQNDIITVHTGYSTTPSYTAYMVGYDSSKQFISGQYWSLSASEYLPERQITLTNSSIAFVRFTFNRNSDAFVKVNGTKVWEYKSVKTGISEYLDGVGVHKTIYDTGKYNSWMPGYIGSDGSTNTSTANSCTGFIDIEGYEKIGVEFNCTTVVVSPSIAFYTSSGTFIKSYQNNISEARGYELRILPVPINAKYVRCSLYNEYLDYWHLEGIRTSSAVLLSPISTSQKVTMEFGNLDTDGQMKPYDTNFFDYARTSLYYKLGSINLPYTYKVYVYDSKYNLIDTISAQPNTEYQLSIDNWHKIVINYTENSLSAKEIVINLNVFEKSYNIITPKTIKTFQYLVKYKKGRGFYSDGNTAYNEVYNMSDDLISNTLRMYLPSNYSPTGEPVKLIYKAHGTNGYSWINQIDWGGENLSLQYLADEGFAIYDMFAGTSYYSDIINPNLIQDYTTRIANYNLPIQLAAQRDAYEWMVRNFNVTPYVYVFGKSHGGLAGIYATNNIVPTRAITLIAPLITQMGDRYAPWGLRATETSMCLEDMCFETPSGMTFSQMVDVVVNQSSGWKDIMSNNIKQQMGLNPYLNGVTNVKQDALLTSLMNDEYKTLGGMDNLIRHSEVPTKVWCAPDDDQVIYANGYNWIKSLQNGGSNAQFRECPSGHGGHSLDAFTGDASLKATITTALGVQYTASVVYAEVVNFFNQF